MRDVFVSKEMVLPKGEDFRSLAEHCLRPSRLYVGKYRL